MKNIGSKKHRKQNREGWSGGVGEKNYEDKVGVEQ